MTDVAQSLANANSKITTTVHGSECMMEKRCRIVHLRTERKGRLQQLMKNVTYSYKILIRRDPRRRPAAERGRREFAWCIS